MCPLHETSPLPRSFAGLVAPGAKHSFEGACGGDARRVARRSALSAAGFVDVLDTTLGDVVARCIDPMTMFRTPTDEAGPVGPKLSADAQETSINCESPSCQPLEAPHGSLRQVRAQRETYVNDERVSIAPYRGAPRLLASRYSFLYGRDSFTNEDFLPGDFASLDI
jgi:hypothetical protein